MHYEFNRESGISFVQAQHRSPDDPRWYYLHAILLMNHEPNSAVELLKKSAERAPETIDMPRLRLALFLTERGDSEAAEMEFRRLLERDPRHAAAGLGLARLLYQQGHGTESVGALQSSLRDLRTRKAAHELLATVQGSIGRTNEARVSAQTAAGLPPDLPWPDPYWDEAAKYRVGLKHSLEQANTLLDSGRATEAVAFLQTTTRDYPAEPEGWYLLGWAFNQQQAFAEAERALRELLRLSTNSTKGLAQLAVALLGQKRFADAIPVLEEALKSKPTWRELHSNLGYACVQLGRAEDAESHYRHALARDPNHVPSRMALGELLLRRGESTQARQVLQEAAKLAPADPRVQALLKKLP
jgi:Flp pilus assembly protein TadD